MRRILLATIGLLAALPVLPITARADQGTVFNGRMPSLSQGRPTSPGSLSPGRFAPAPVPNPDVQATGIRRDGNDVALVPSLTRVETDKTTGDGFSPGSSFSGSMERRDRGAGGIGSTLAPSLKIKVPVQVELR